MEFAFYGGEKRSRLPDVRSWSLLGGVQIITVTQHYKYIYCISLCINVTRGETIIKKLFVHKQQ